MKKHFLQTQDGFTLIELMVSIAIFTVVVTAVIGSVYSANASAHKVQDTETVLNNANFAFESMVRTIRTGTIVSCADTTQPADDGTGNVCNTDSPANFIIVYSTLGRDSYIKYYYGDDNSIQKEELPIVNGVASTSWGDAIAVTAPSVSVSKLQFNFMGLTAGSSNQRGAFIVFSGFANDDSQQTPFALQTFVSQRNFTQ